MNWAVLRRSRVVITTVIVAAVAALAGYAVDAKTRNDRSVLGPGLVHADIGIFHSRFSKDRIVIRDGTVVDFRIQNDDPINHEFVVGTSRVHRQHRRGTEAFHPPVPGEVSIGPNTEGSTFYRFDEPGTYEFICHLPGHEAYGMVGEIEVVGAA